MNYLHRARNFAHQAHDSIKQTRKYTGEPYWKHTDEVADIVMDVMLPIGRKLNRNDLERADTMIMAAHLHDVIEDVGNQLSSQISYEFGEKVLQLVWEVSDIFTAESRPGWNRAKRKEMEANRLSTVSADAQTIKVADLISNTASIVKHDPDFAKVYLKEKEYLLSKLTKASPVLLDRAFKQLTEAKNKLNM